MSSENGPSDAGSAGTDPRVLRALAHPLRLDLLYLLARDQPLTASQCAEHFGVSAKVCSYHLNLLARHGLVEETGEGVGRARPWRLRPQELAYVHEDAERPSTARAADEFARTMLAHDAGIVEGFIRGRHALPAEWRNVATLSSQPLRLTREQLRRAGAEMTAVLAKYRAEAATDPTDPDARPVHVAIYAVPTDVPPATS